MDDYQKYIHISRYAKWIPELGRRETWEETVSRFTNYFPSLPKYINKAIKDMEVMPSMRCMMTAGKALKQNNIAGYNCAYVAVDHPRAFDETLYILMHGTGIGFSVEEEYVKKLPDVPDEIIKDESTIVVADSKEGWQKAFRTLLSLLWAGQKPQIDYSKIRPAGARLHTFGGRASGPDPLRGLFDYCIRTFKGATGRGLTSLECHDLMCMIAKTIIVGGVRRSALLSLSDLSDHRMRKAKFGQWWNEREERSFSNNSVAYQEKPDITSFLKEMKTLYDSKSGERGIFNRVAATKQANRSGRRDTCYDFGCNPCSEIILRSAQFCNLTEVVVRYEDTLEVLKEKVKKATILGTFQATLTNFKGLRRKWKVNTEEESLLGVSLTGIMDHPVLRGDKGEMKLRQYLKDMKDVAIKTNKVWARKLDINPATAITCVKPSGTVSQLVNSSSGIHPRIYPYYTRTVQNDKKDPLAQLMIDQGVPFTEDNDVYYFKFPSKSPDKAKLQENLGAMEQLRLWQIYNSCWCEHKPSQTIYYNDDEFIGITNWVWNNWDDISGISFFPFSDHVLENSPYVPITEDEYQSMSDSFPFSITWESLTAYEQEDNTDTKREFACSGGACEI